MAVVKSGGREVIFSRTILAADDEYVEIAFNHGDNTFKFGITFRSYEGVSPKVNWSFLDDTLQIVVDGWNSPIGTALTEPVKLGNVDGTTFGFHLAQFRVGKINRADFQVLLGEGNYAQPQ